MKPSIPTLLCAAALIIAPTIASPPVRSQNNIVIFGSDRDATLPYRVRNNRASSRLNTFNFFAPLPANRAIAEIQILYPDGFGGVFRNDSIRLVNRETQRPIAIREITHDRETRDIRVIFKEPIAAESIRQIEVIASGVSNPSRTGMYSVQVHALGTEANPLFQYIGRWLVTIN
ncbi:MAG: DUF2808 domain-containing protein [Oscillatoriales cyanobacterium SM2_2_1]|nr:DUF2808 domain-containing protein [Oscillatoriales cyanobacterium SM2_2_1]